MKRTILGVIFFVCLMCDQLSSYAQSAQETKNQLIKKGFSEEVIKLLTPKCQESLKKSVPDGVVWYASFDRDARSVTVDFQADKTHNSITVVSLNEGGCMTVQNMVIMRIGPCKGEVKWWTDLYKKRGIKLKIEEESEQRICLSTEGKLAMKVYLYPMGNLCMEVFRNLETIK